MYFIFIIFQGFFRRSIQQKIQYRPCTKNQQCNILRINRNRCQYCRLKKCIAAGMSRDGKYFSIIYKIIVHCSKIRKMVQNEKCGSHEICRPPDLQGHSENIDFKLFEANCMRLPQIALFLDFTALN